MTDDDQDRLRALMNVARAVARLAPITMGSVRLFIAAYEVMYEREQGEAPSDVTSSVALAFGLDLAKHRRALTVALEEVERPELLDLVRRIDRARFADVIPGHVLTQLSDGELRRLARALCWRAELA